MVNAAFMVGGKQNILILETVLRPRSYVITKDLVIRHTYI